MFKFIFKALIFGIIIYVILLTVNDNTNVPKNPNDTIIERSCSYFPNLCHNSEVIFYSAGNAITNGLYKLYVLSSQYLTQDSIAPH